MKREEGVPRRTSVTAVPRSNLIIRTVHRPLLSDPPVYTPRFYEEEGESSEGSAPEVVPALLRLGPIHSVLDVGCGVGAFLAEFLRSGVREAIGIEGEWIRSAPIAIPNESIAIADLRQRFDLGRTFDMVLCLEVAEHLEADFAGGLIESIVRHGDLIAFGAGVPSQGGTHHVNLRWPDFWAGQFRRKGFDCFDAVRPVLARNPRVSKHYAQNLLVYARRGSDAHRRLMRTGTFVAGHVPFVVHAWPHPVLARFMNHLPPEVREYVYLHYRTRWRRFLPASIRYYM